MEQGRSRESRVSLISIGKMSRDILRDKSASRCFLIHYYFRNSISFYFISSFLNIKKFVQTIYQVFAKFENHASIAHKYLLVIKIDGKF